MGQTFSIFGNSNKKSQLQKPDSKLNLSLMWTLKAEMPQLNRNGTSCATLHNVENQPTIQEQNKCIAFAPPAAAAQFDNGQPTSLPFCRHCPEGSLFQKELQPTLKLDQQLHKCIQRHEEIKQIEDYLTSSCSTYAPANIPLLLTANTILFQRGFNYYQVHQMHLPLGLVVVCTYKHNNWMFVRTPNGCEGFIPYDSSCCFIDTRQSQENWRHIGRKNDRKPMELLGGQKHINNFDSSCITFKDGVRKGHKFRSCRSEGTQTPRFVPKSKTSIDQPNLINTINTMSLKSDIQGVVQYGDVPDVPTLKSYATRQTLLFVNDNFMSNSITVEHGEVVTLLACKDFWNNQLLRLAPWFFVAKRDGTRGYIPAQVAGNGFL